MSTWLAKRLSNLVIVIGAPCGRALPHSGPRAGGGSNRPEAQLHARSGLACAAADEKASGMGGGRNGAEPRHADREGFAGRSPGRSRSEPLEGGQALGGGVGQVARGSAGNLYQRAVRGDPECRDPAASGG